MRAYNNTIEVVRAVRSGFILCKTRQIETSKREMHEGVNLFTGGVGPKAERASKLIRTDLTVKMLQLKAK